MPLFDDDQESGGSQDNSSDDEQNDQNEQPEPMDEGDYQEGDDDGEDEDDEGDDENDDEDQTNEQDDTRGSEPDARMKPSGASSSSQVKLDDTSNVPTSLGQTPHLPPPAQSGPSVTVTVPSPQGSPTDRGSEPDRFVVRPEALAASVYDIVPTIAAPQSTSINVVTATPDLRWVFSGGSDGYIRKFNWLDTANGKLMLTVAQRHPFVDSVTKAGVLTSYWENEEPIVKPGEDGQSLSPVYSLAVHNKALWLLSGLESGGINLTSVRHEEGKRIHCLKKHTSAVSVLNLAQDELSVLSGSWDKLVMDWDLNTGNVKRTFDGSGGQISAIEMRPASSLPVPESSGEPILTNGTLSSNSDSKPLTNGVLTNGNGSATSANETANENSRQAMSPVDSLFGEDDNGSLFGESSVPNPTGFGDDEDEFSRAIANGVPQPDNEDEGDVSMIDVGGNDDPPQANGVQEYASQAEPAVEPSAPPEPASTIPLTNGLPHAEDPEKQPEHPEAGEDTRDRASQADTTFLAASIDGSIRIWDKRQQTPVAKIISRNAPPWCMGACWSPDGNSMYAGRRNGTVEEFNLHKGLRSATRTFKFPNGSGPVSAVRAMPNGRHLVCASYDILRLYDLSQQQIFKHSTVPFLIVPGHRTGVVSQLYVDPTCRFMISTAGNRGWEGTSTQVLLGYEINI